MTFEWLVAWRYLRDRDKPNRWVLVVGLLLLLIGGGLWLLQYMLPDPQKTPHLQLGGYHLTQLALYGAIGLSFAGILVTVFGACLAFFNIFTTISVFGVFLGVTALIVVLAVMSGFEDDLKAKILGNNAHILIQGTDDHLPHAKKIMKLLSANGFSRDGKSPAPMKASSHKSLGETHGFVAMAPYLQAEVILSGIKTHAGVYLKGIEPESADKVSELGSNIEEGVLDNLIYPQRLRYLYVSLEDDDHPGASIHMTDPIPPPDDLPVEISAPPGSTIEPKPLNEVPPPSPSPSPSSPSPSPSSKEHPGTPGMEASPAATPEQKSTEAHPLPKPAARKPDLLIRSIRTEPAKVAFRDLDQENMEALFKDKPEKVGSKEGDEKEFHPPVSEFSPIRLLTENRRVLPGIILGRELAKTLGLKLGYNVDVVSPEAGGVGPMGPVPRLKTFRVAGIFYSGHYEFDTKYAYVDLKEAQEFLKRKGQITGIEIRVKNTRRATKSAQDLRKMLGVLGEGIKVKDWQNLHRNLFSALKLEKIVMFLVLTIIILVASFSIGCNLIMVVHKKRGEVATLKSMGADNTSIYKIFFFDGLYIGIIGMILGLLAGLGICAALAAGGLRLDPEIYYISKLPVRVEALDVALICAACLAISFAATLYPAWQAAQLEPVEAFRVE